MGDQGEQLNEKMGIEVTDWNPDRVVATMPVKGNLQPYGLLHGGANAVLAEAVGSVCAALKSDGKPTVGLELSCTHHRGVRDGFVTAVATPLHVGRSTVTVEIVITDESDRRTCTARLTCMVLQTVPGE
nr:hotdog fold thioesterase [Kibdelosporangium sp. MJ126-NF4]CEL17677.1 ComA operon protein 2 [Kibdelosporangium sp. MJ126-NF4]CTQ91096.1 ComA operon protein 2 [Kibdelosporangium sp. MJ126-NF4]